MFGPKINCKIRYHVFFIGFSLFFLGCGTSSIRIESEPSDADVTLFVVGNPPKLVGKTPMILTDEMLGSTSKAFQIGIQKVGHRSENIALPESFGARAANVNFRLRPDAPKDNTMCTIQNEAYQKLARGIAENQALIKNKSFDEAEARLVALASQYPTVAVIYDLLGNVYYINRQFEKALVAYKRANELAPDGIETQRMIRKLSSIRGGGE